jgi:hypothetical protein
MAIRKPSAGEPVTELWKSVTSVISEIEVMKRQLFTLQQTNTTLLAQRNFASHGLHPFKLYRYPDRLRTSAASSDWRKFIVRGGRVSDVPGASVTGTDLIEDAYSDTLPTVGSYEVTVAASVAAHYFWIVLGAGTATISNGTTPPTFDGTKILIGYVDTLTDVATTQARVRQYLTDHIVNPRITLCISGTATTNCLLV